MFGAYDLIEKQDPLFGGLSPNAICETAVRHTYGALRLATALVRAIESKDALRPLVDGKRPLPSSLGVSIRAAIERGDF